MSDWDRPQGLCCPPRPSPHPLMCWNQPPRPPVTPGTSKSPRPQVPLLSWGEAITAACARPSEQVVGVPEWLWLTC